MISVKKNSVLIFSKNPRKSRKVVTKNITRSLKMSDSLTSSVKELEVIFLIRNAIINEIIIGEAPTVAAWIRSFVLKHPTYAKDSIITPVK